MVSKAELKFIRSLKIKKYRTGAQRFLVEGEKNVLELLSSDFEVDTLLVSTAFLEKYHTQAQPFSPREVSLRDLSEASSLVTNDQALAVVKMKEFDLSIMHSAPVVLALDGINDPGNLGTIIRTMDWFGLRHLVCSPDTVEFYNPKTIHSTMGSFTRVQFAYADLSGFLAAHPGRKVGAQMQGTPVHEWKPALPTVLVMGSESHGIRPEVQAQLDDSVTIPRLGQAESLNVGVATGILCHHLMSSTR